MQSRIRNDEVGAWDARRKRRGTAAVEMAVVLPVITTMLLGMWEIGRLIEIQQLLTNAAREAARHAAGGTATTSQVQNVAINYLGAAKIPTQDVTVTIVNLGFPGNPPPTSNDPTAANQLDQLQVTVTIPFSDVRWIALNLFTDPNTVLTAGATWCSIKDVAYPAVSYPPIE